MKNAAASIASTSRWSGRINYSNLFYFILWAKILFYYLNFKWICKNEIFISSNGAWLSLFLSLESLCNKPNSTSQIWPGCGAWKKHPNVPGLTQNNNKKTTFNHSVMSNEFKHIALSHCWCWTVVDVLPELEIPKADGKKGAFFTRFFQLGFFLPAPSYLAVSTFSIEFCIFPICVLNREARTKPSTMWWIFVGTFSHSGQMLPAEVCALPNE